MEEGESMTPLPAEEEGDKDLVARSLEQRSWRIKELIETENDYVNYLAQVNTKRSKVCFSLSYSPTLSR